MLEDKMNLEVINFTNIDKESFNGQWAGEITVIKAGETRPFPRFLANHYAKHLANKILIRGGQDWSNVLLREPLLKQILGEISVSVEKVEIKTESPVEQTKVEEPAKTEKPVETISTEPETFAGAPKEEVQPTPKKRGRKPKAK